MKTKSVIAAALISAMTVTSVSPALAGNLAAPQVDSAVTVSDEAAAAGGLNTTGLIIGGLLAVAVIAAVASNDSSSSTN